MISQKVKEKVFKKIQIGNFLKKVKKNQKFSLKSNIIRYDEIPNEEQVHNNESKIN